MRDITSSRHRSCHYPGNANDIYDLCGAYYSSNYKGELYSNTMSTEADTYKASEYYKDDIHQGITLGYNELTKQWEFRTDKRSNTNQGNLVLSKHYTRVPVWVNGLKESKKLVLAH